MPVNISNLTNDAFGKIIRKHRQKTGLSIKELADLAGLGKTVIFDIEHGKDTVRFSSLKKVLHALNISVLLESPLMNHLMENGNEKS
nr:helix-turn-helix transcriptional regulator [Desulfobulbaceae bacterium]